MTDLKQLARRIFRDALAAIDIPRAMRRKLDCRGSLVRCGDAVVDLRKFEKIRIVAIGKAAHTMLDGLRSCLPSEISLEGIASAPHPPKQAHAEIRYFIGGHPTPNEESWKAAQAILEMLAGCGEHTLVFFLLSGGGSALVELPLEERLSL